MAKKNKIKKEQFIEVLQQIPEEDLRSFIKEILSEPVVKTQFLKAFESYFINKDSVKVYLNQIAEAFYDAKDEYDYIPFDKQSILFDQMYDVLEAANTFREKGIFKATIDICFEILREAIIALDNSDDSEGYLSIIINEAFNSLHALDDEEVCILDENGRTALMDACWSCIQDKVFNGWDWHLDIYKILYQHANCEKEYDEILEKLENDTNLKEGYMYSEMMMLKKDLLTEYKGAEAGKQFALQHLQIEKFRRQAIQDAMQDSDYQRAYQLCEEGIIQDKEYQGLVTQWNQWKLEIAQKEDNKQMVKEVTCYLLLNENHLKEEYYKLLKEVIPTEQWPAFIVQLSEMALPAHGGLYTDICAKEGWTEKLHAYLQKNSYISTFIKYESALLPTYREELIDRYIQHAIRMMDVHERNRRTYQNLCDYLQRAIRIGGRDKVNQAKAKLQTQYKRCRALQDELSHVS